MAKPFEGKVEGNRHSCWQTCTLSSSETKDQILKTNISNGPDADG